MSNTTQHTTSPFHASINGIMLERKLSAYDARNYAQNLVEGFDYTSKTSLATLGATNLGVAVKELPDNIYESIGSKDERISIMKARLSEWEKKQDILYFYNGRDLIATFNKKTKKLCLKNQH